MSVNLTKGGNVSLTDLVKGTGTTLERIAAACGWDVNQAKGGKDFDLDLTAACLDASGKVPAKMDPKDKKYQEYFIHANHRKPSSGFLEFLGDNRTGAGEGDDETIKGNLTLVPEEIVRINFAVVVYWAKKRKQNFGAVENAFIRIYDEVTGREFARFNLSKGFEEDTLVHFGELYRHNGMWKFRAIGDGYKTAADYRQQFNIVREFETEYARFNN